MKRSSHKIPFLVFAVLLGLISSTNLFAQQHPQYSLFNYNINIYNPAYTGTNNSLSVTAHGRAQWLGINGYPFSQNLVVQMPLYGIRGGVGLTVMNNQQGLQRNTHAGLNYAFIISKPKYIFSIGVRGGIIQSSLDGTKIITPEGSYEGGTVNHNDNILPIGLINNIQFDAAAGMLYQRKRIFIGVSAVNLTEPKLSLTQNNNGPVLIRNYFGIFSYNINLSKNVLFKNAFLVKYDLNDMQEESNISFKYKELGWIGVGYRGFTKENNDALYSFIGIKLSKRLTGIYSYDYILSDLSKASNGSHEVLIQYNLELSQVAKPGKVIFTPRF